MKAIEAVVEIVLESGREVMLGAVGAVRSTVQDEVVVVLVFPAWSVCLTCRECEPSVSPVIERGLVQVVNEALSSEQVNVAFASPVNGTDALVWLVLAGDVDVIVGAGIGVAPMTHDQLVSALTLPA